MSQNISMEQIFTIIGLAGDAKSGFYQAFELIKNNEYEEAEKLIKEANETLTQAHRIQTELITLEAQGNKSEVGVILIHAQDHLMNAILTKELINHMISMQKQINELKK
ncbi:PTS lactose/cellobiose transporter subunit IIA [Alkalithermobacter paradoxus]|uniref:PTS system lactose-specific EIIA component n=1 Tax=Alkalithermobacter paradoxus TaxID=29349 RepID=A0A1V4I7Y5_9FIRM|nr:lactose-specific phosphotransferase enzyme IIA component [[Clostridium] thermoalcaliphilum]